MVDVFVNLAEHNLNISSEDIFNKTVAVIGIADLLISRGIKDVDEEPLTVGFFGLFNELKDLGLLV